MARDRTDFPRCGTSTGLSGLWFFAILLPLTAVLVSCATPATAEQTARVYYDLGNAYARLGEQDKATAAYLNALKLDGSLLQATYNLARAYISSNNLPKAIDLLDKLLARDPENFVVLDTLGFAYYREGDKPRALYYYDQVLGLSSTNENALYNRAMILSEEGKNQEAINGLQKLYGITNDPSLLFLLGKLELLVGKPEEGIHYLKAYRTAKPDDFDGLMTLADAYRSEKLYAKALGAYGAAIALKPAAPAALFAKAEILLTAVQDEASGLKSLKIALDAGFSNRNSIDALLANPELVGKSAVEALLKGKDLLNPSSTTETVSPGPKD